MDFMCYLPKLIVKSFVKMIILWFLPVFVLDIFMLSISHKDQKFVHVLLLNFLMDGFVIEGLDM